MKKNHCYAVHYKLIIFVILLTLSLIGASYLTFVEAVPPSAIEGITIRIEDSACSGDTPTFANHIDLLVKKSDVIDRIMMTPNAQYTALFGHISSIDYLEEDAIWVSYLAYVGNATLQEEHACYMTFMVEPDDYKVYSQIKLVYFNDQGETLFISEPIENTIAGYRESRYGDIEFIPSDNFRIENTYRLFGGWGWIAALIIGVYILRILLWVFIGIAGLLSVYAVFYVVIKQIKRYRNRPKT